MPLRLLMPCLCLALAACEARVDVELGTADLDGLSAVRMTVTGVDLLDADGELHTLEAGIDEALELRDLVDGQTLSLIEGANLQSGRYTGLRLRFADSGHTVELEDGTEAALTPGDTTAFADLDVKLDEDATTTLVATLDLRFSLQRDAATGAYSLTPVLRAVDADTAGSLYGTIDADAVQSSACRRGRSAGTGVAVYLFERDTDALVDYQRDRSGPVASARVQADGNRYGYEFPYLLAGDYTIAWTCEADADTLDAEQSLSFEDDYSLTLEEGESQDVDF